MEKWDLLDENRNLTGETLTRGSVMPKGRYHLVVHCVLFNSKGEMLIQKRQPFKDGWPGMWDVTVGGSAVMGEDSKTAVTREVWEEIGLWHEFSGVPSMTVTFDTGFDDIWVITRDDIDINTLHLQESEVEQVRWATVEEIKQMIAEKTFIEYEPALMDVFFHLKDHHGLHTHE